MHGTIKTMMQDWFQIETSLLAKYNAGIHAINSLLMMLSHICVTCQAISVRNSIHIFSLNPVYNIKSTVISSHTFSLVYLIKI